MNKQARNTAIWGLVLIIIGLLFFLRTLWGIHFPIFRVIISLLLIGIGIVLIMGRFGFRRGDNYTIFSESRISYNPSEKSYGCIFGKLDLDLTTVDPNKQKEIEVLCTFGEVNVNIRKDVGFLIESNTTFGETKIPDKEYNFGSGRYQSPDYSPEKPYLLIKTKVVFGSLKVHLI